MKGKEPVPMSMKAAKEIVGETYEVMESFQFRPLTVVVARCEYGDKAFYVVEKAECGPRDVWNVGRGYEVAGGRAVKALATKVRKYDLSQQRARLELEPWTMTVASVLVPA